MTTVEPVAEATPIDRAKGPYRRTHMLAAVVLIGLIAALWACSLPWYHFEMHNVTVETPSYQKVTVNVSTYKSGFALAHATQPTNDTIGQGPIQGPAGPPALAGMPIAAAMLMMVGAFILLGVITKLGLLSVLGFLMSPLVWQSNQRFAASVTNPATGGLMNHVASGVPIFSAILLGTLVFGALCTGQLMWANHIAHAEAREEAQAAGQPTHGLLDVLWLTASRTLSTFTPPGQHAGADQRHD